MFGEYLNGPFCSTHLSDRLIIIVTIILVDVIANVCRPSKFWWISKWPSPWIETPICAMMNILSALPSYFVLASLCSRADHHSHNSPMLDNHNLAFSAPQLIHDQSLLSDLASFAALTDFHQRNWAELPIALWMTSCAYLCHCSALS